MNRSLIAALAMCTGVALASPMLAWSADPPATDNQPGPSQPSAGGPMGRGMAEHFGWGPMGHHGGMHDMMMHHMAQLSPQQRCEERLARRAAMVAYTVTKLNLTAEQRPLWDKVNAALQNGAQQQQQLCNALKGVQPSQMTLLDRINRQEQVLTARLQALQQVKPPLEQLYQALTPEQKAIADHPFRAG